MSFALGAAACSSDDDDPSDPVENEVENEVEGELEGELPPPAGELPPKLDAEL